MNLVFFRVFLMTTFAKLSQNLRVNHGSGTVDTSHVLAGQPAGADAYAAACVGWKSWPPS